jgi:hypothetical protein
MGISLVSILVRMRYLKYMYYMTHISCFYILHCSVAEGKSVVVQLEWSMDGNRLLALSEDSTIKVHRMKVSLDVCS